MTEVPEAAIEVTGLSWVPPMARGLVRDFRVRWALEEMGLSYRTRLYDRRISGPEDRQPEQPFGQVPAFVEGDVRLFESGAIVLHLAERSELLMPRDEFGRARALSWAIAALNSVEPYIFLVQCVGLFDSDKPGAEAFKPTAEERLRGRFGQLSEALGTSEWLEDRFTVGDLLMASVLRQVERSGRLAAFPNLAAYLARAQSRPAFIRAIDAQMDDFLPETEEA